MLIEIYFITGRKFTQIILHHRFGLISDLIHYLPWIMCVFMMCEKTEGESGLSLILTVIQVML